MRRSAFVLRSNGRRLLLGESTAIMGALNITPDSFSDGGDYYDNVGLAVARAGQTLSDGADIIDVGGESTRPGAEPVTEAEELRRIIPVIKEMRRALGNGFFISVDTYKAEVAAQALMEGADMVNSLGGFGFDMEMAGVIRRFKCPIAMYHVRGTPKTMRQFAGSGTDVVKEVGSFFRRQMLIAKKAGIGREQLIIDPGIGFGKSVEENLDVVRRLGEFCSFKVPIMVGMSRKLHLGKLIKAGMKAKGVPPAKERIEAALAESAIAIINGASIIRTHDVLQTKKFASAMDIIISRRLSGRLAIKQVDD